MECREDLDPTGTDRKCTVAIRRVTREVPAKGRRTCKEVHTDHAVRTQARWVAHQEDRRAQHRT